MILTMGEKGSLLVTEKNRINPRQKSKGGRLHCSGDVFVGTLACCLAEGRDLLSSINFANSAAALSVTKMGAQSSIPNRNEVGEFIMKG